MRVLYVEDEKFLADAVKFNLEKQGISVDIAPDGEEGLVFTIHATSPVLILNDVLDIDFFTTAWAVLNTVGAAKAIWATAQIKFVHYSAAISASYLHLSPFFAFYSRSHDKPATC